MVHFRDTDPRPLHADVSPSFARQREERIDLAEILPPPRPASPPGYDAAVAEANRRAAAAEPLDGREPNLVFRLRRAYVAGFVDHWLASR